ncbi:energy transducer TonB [candidate division KSB1 bacterium]
MVNTLALTLFGRLRFHIPEKHRLPAAVALSVIVHIVFLLLGHYDIISLKKDVSLAAVPLEEEKRLVFEIVESNPDAEIAQPEDDTPFASDRNSRAQDLNPQINPAAVRAMDEALIESKEITAQSQTAAQQEANKSITQFKQFEPPDLTTGISVVQQKKQQDENQLLQQSAQNENKAAADNKLVSPESLGSMSLSTYAWNFAPYMLEVKRKIQKNIRPPTTFNMGLIKGTFVLKFIISKSGKVPSIEVLESRGAKPLELTSYNAIQYSGPFKPLPDDFPDDVLVITATFRYY